MNLAFIVGRTPALAYAEIERAAAILPFRWSLSRVGSDVVLLRSADATEGSDITFSDLPPQHYDVINRLQRRLGGTLRIVELTGVTTNRKAVEQLAEALKDYGAGKLTIALSAFGAGFPVMKIGLSIKQSLKRNGRSARIVLPTEGDALSTAQVVGNALNPSRGGIEIVMIAQGATWLVGRTLTVQDINDYRHRDFDIPVSDPVSGMLSPKVAQSMINVAVGGEEGVAVYDPFCGNGRVVEEAALMGFYSCGSDISQAKVDAASANLEWFDKEYGLSIGTSSDRIWLMDATIAAPPYSLPKGTPYYIVGEPYLGKPLRSPLRPSEEARWKDELTGLYDRFFTSWSQLASHLRPQGFVLVFPAAKRQAGSTVSIYKTLVDRLGELGYSHYQVSEYGRPDASVVREIVRLSYKEPLLTTSR